MNNLELKDLENINGGNAIVGFLVHMQMVKLQTLMENMFQELA